MSLCLIPVRTGVQETKSEFEIKTFSQVSFYVWIIKHTLTYFVHGTNNTKNKNKT